MTDLTIYFIILMGLIFIFGIAIMVNQKHILERYENDYHTYLNYLRETQGWVFEHIDQSAKNADRIINRLDNISYDLYKVLNDKNKVLSGTSDQEKSNEEMFNYKDLVEKGFAVEVPE